MYKRQADKGQEEAVPAGETFLDRVSVKDGSRIHIIHLEELLYLQAGGDVYKRQGGGSGLPFSSELPNGWSVRFSACPVLDVNKQHTEFGIDPDTAVAITGEDIMKGRDTIIEAAIGLLLAKGDSAISY